MHACRQAGSYIGMHACRQAGRQAGMQAGRQKIERGRIDGRQGRNETGEGRKFLRVI